ncbi:hypothetical protein C7D73_29805, partial [Klebsiella pneumoniae]
MSVDPGDRERGTVYSRWTTDERGRSPCSRTVCRIERWSVFPDSAAWRSHEHGQCQIWFCSRPQSV